MTNFQLLDKISNQQNKQPDIPVYRVGRFSDVGVNYLFQIMGKVKPHTIKRSKRLKMFNDFYNIVYGLKGKKEVIKFFMVLLSSSENLMFVRRIQIAQMLLSEKSNVEIKKELKVGSDNIINVSKWLYDKSNAIFKEQIMKSIEKNKK